MGVFKNAEQLEGENKIIKDLTFSRNVSDNYTKLVNGYAFLVRDAILALQKITNINPSNITEIYSIGSMGLLKGIYSYSIFVKESLSDYLRNSVNKELAEYLANPDEYYYNNASYVLTKDDLSMRISANVEEIFSIENPPNMEVTANEDISPDKMLSELDTALCFNWCETVNNHRFILIPEDYVRAIANYLTKNSDLSKEEENPDI